MRSLIFLSVVVLSVVSANALFADIANKTLDIASHFIDKLKFLVKVTNEPSDEEAESSDQVSPAKRAKVLAQATAATSEVTENVKNQPEAPQTASPIAPVVVISEKSAVLPQVTAQVNQQTPPLAAPVTAVKIVQQAQPVTAATVTTVKAVPVQPQGQKANLVTAGPAVNAQVQPKTGKK